MIFIIASLAFAILDIINKKFVVVESTISMLFYPAVITTILSFPLVINEWHTPTTIQLLLLFVLGCNANLILFFLLKAFLLVDATAVAPYRYFELILSSSLGYMIFTEIPDKNALYGAVGLMIVGTFITISEMLVKNK